MFIPVPRTTPLSPGGRGRGVRLTRGPKGKFVFPLLENFKMQKKKKKKNHSCEKGHVICVTGASGPMGAPKQGPRGPRAKIAIFKHYLL